MTGTSGPQLSSTRNGGLASAPTATRPGSVLTKWATSRKTSKSFRAESNVLRGQRRGCEFHFVQVVQLNLSFVHLWTGKIELINVSYSDLTIKGRNKTDIIPGIFIIYGETGIQLLIPAWGLSCPQENSGKQARTRCQVQPVPSSRASREMGCDRRPRQMPSNCRTVASLAAWNCASRRSTVSGVSSSRHSSRSRAGVVRKIDLSWRGIKKKMGPGLSEGGAPIGCREPGMKKACRNFRPKF